MSILFLPTSRSPAMQVRQLNTLTLHICFQVGPRKNRPLDARCHCAADQAVEPVVVRLLGPELPHVHHPAASLGAHAVFGRQMLGHRVRQKEISTTSPL